MGILATKLLLVCGTALLILGVGLGVMRAFTDSSAQYVMYDLQEDEHPAVIQQTYAGSRETSTLNVIANSADASLIAADYLPNGDALVVQATEDGLGIFRADLATNTLTALTSNFERAFEPAVSPDGEWIVFTVESTSFQLWLMRSDGSDMRPVTFDADRNWQAAWYPDSQHVAFSRMANRSMNLYQMNAFTGDMTALTASDALDATPAVSPDGQLIAFVSSNGRSYQLHVMQADGSNLKQLTEGQRLDSDPVFSSDSKWIYFASYDGTSKNIYRIRTDGSSLQAVTNTDGNASRPTLSTPIERSMQMGWTIITGLGMVLAGSAFVVNRRRNRTNGHGTITTQFMLPTFDE